MIKAEHRRTVAAALLAIVLVGCEPHGAACRKVVGKDKAEVLKIMGEPLSVTWDKATEYECWRDVSGFGFVSYISFKGSNVVSVRTL